MRVQRRTKAMSRSGNVLDLLDVTLAGLKAWKGRILRARQKRPVQHTCEGSSPVMNVYTQTSTRFSDNRGDENDSGPGDEAHRFECEVSSISERDEDYDAASTPHVGETLHRTTPPWVDQAQPPDSSKSYTSQQPNTYPGSEEYTAAERAYADPNGLRQSEPFSRPARLDEQYIDSFPRQVQAPLSSRPQTAALETRQRPPVPVTRPWLEDEEPVRDATRTYRRPVRRPVSGARYRPRRGSATRNHQPASPGLIHRAEQPGPVTYLNMEQNVHLNTMVRNELSHEQVEGHVPSASVFDDHDENNNSDDEPYHGSGAAVEPPSEDDYADVGDGGAPESASQMRPQKDERASDRRRKDESTKTKKPKLWSKWQARRTRDRPGQDKPVGSRVTQLNPDREAADRAKYAGLSEVNDTAAANHSIDNSKPSRNVDSQNKLANPTSEPPGTSHKADSASPEIGPNNRTTDPNDRLPYDSNRSLDPRSKAIDPQTHPTGRNIIPPANNNTLPAQQLPRQAANCVARKPLPSLPHQTGNQRHQQGLASPSTEISSVSTKSNGGNNEQRYAELGLAGATNSPPGKAKKLTFRSFFGASQKTARRDGVLSRDMTGDARQIGSNGVAPTSIAAGRPDRLSQGHAAIGRNRSTALDKSIGAGRYEHDANRRPAGSASMGVVATTTPGVAIGPDSSWTRRPAFPTAPILPKNSALSASLALLPESPQIRRKPLPPPQSHQIPRKPLTSPPSQSNQHPVIPNPPPQSHQIRRKPVPLPQGPHRTEAAKTPATPPMAPTATGVHMTPNPWSAIKASFQEPSPPLQQPKDPKSSTAQKSTLNSVRDHFHSRPKADAIAISEGLFSGARTYNTSLAPRITPQQGHDPIRMGSNRHNLPTRPQQRSMADGPQARWSMGEQRTPALGAGTRMTRQTRVTPKASKQRANARRVIPIPKLKVGEGKRRKR